MGRVGVGEGLCHGRARSRRADACGVPRQRGMPAPHSGHGFANVLGLGLRPARGRHVPARGTKPDPHRRA
ncbi:Hypothetical protein A7982_04591 [Minicystis rosea]|nr:Hypothetical protein A7982_04591 [Minicystis rosea]